MKNMDRNRILELALEGLQKQKAGIDQEIEMIQAELSGRGSTVREKPFVPAVGTARGRLRTPAERKAQGERMRQYWAAKRAKAAKVTTAPKTSPAAGPKRRMKTAAEKKALSLKMREIWKKRRAATAKSAKTK
jgi:nucleoid-associated protein YgaU